MGMRLGQNFLKYPEIAAKIVRVAEITPKDIVLEVGPGRGVLTAELLKHAGGVVAIEKDKRLADFLVAKFAAEIATKKLILLRGDALDFDPREQGLYGGKYKIVANIPYYITGALIRKFLDSEQQPASMTLLVQKEVAERIIAKSSRLNLLTLSVRCYGAPLVAFKVSRASFAPPPKVDSAVVTIKNISRDFFSNNKISEADFFTLLHAGFAHPRKQLAGNLAGNPQFEASSRFFQDAALEKGKENILKVFKIIGILPTARAENLSLEDWGKLVKKLAK